VTQPKPKAHLRVAAQLSAEMMSSAEIDIASEAALHRRSQAASLPPPRTPTAHRTTASGGTPNRFPESVGDDDGPRDGDSSEDSEIMGSDAHSNSALGAEEDSEMGDDMDAAKERRVWTDIRHPLLNTTFGSVRSSPGTERRGGMEVDVGLFFLKT
jgi:hypothetical protein